MQSAVVLLSFGFMLAESMTLAVTVQLFKDFNYKGRGAFSFFYASTGWEAKTLTGESVVG